MSSPARRPLRLFVAILVYHPFIFCAEAMEPFHPRPFHKVGSTRDEVANLKKQYESLPHERKISSGKRMSGDSGVIDPAAIQAHADAANAAAKADDESDRKDGKSHGARSKFSQAFKSFQSSFAAVEGEGETPVWALQKPNKNSRWDDKKMQKLIESAPAGKKSYFETVGILQKAGVDLGKMDGHKSSGHGETAIDIDMIPRNKRGFFKNQEKLAKNPDKMERWEALKKKAEHKGWKEVHGELAKLDHNGKAVAPEKVSRRPHPSRRLLSPAASGEGRVINAGHAGEQ